MLQNFSHNVNSVCASLHCINTVKNSCKRRNTVLNCFVVSGPEPRSVLFPSQLTGAERYTRTPQLPATARILIPDHNLSTSLVTETFHLKGGVDRRETL